MVEDIAITKPTVSILLSVYNGQKFVDSCLRSIERQTFDNWELVCVNDGSSDSTATRLQQWKSVLGDKMLVVNNERNIGLTRSLNKGLRFVRGSFVARIDIDDVWFDNKLEKQMSYLSHNPEVDLLGCQYKTEYFSRDLVSNLPISDKDIRSAILRSNPFCHSCVVIKKEILNGVGGYDGCIRYAQDLDLWFRLLSLVNVANLPEVLCFRCSKNGLSLKHPHVQMWQSIKIRLKYLSKCNSSLFDYLSLWESIAILLTPIWLKRGYYYLRNILFKV